MSGAVSISRPHHNPHGQRIRAGGMTLINCTPDCDAEFRSGSHDSVIHAQLEAAGWQVTERSENGRKAYTYRCPVHRVIERGVMSGRPMPPRAKKETTNERKMAGRASHDFGEGGES